jgi:hypothetical protein
VRLLRRRRTAPKATQPRETKAAVALDSGLSHASEVLPVAGPATELCLPRLVSSPDPRRGVIDGRRAFSRNPGRRARQRAYSLGTSAMKALEPSQREDEVAVARGLLRWGGA